MKQMFVDTRAKNNESAGTRTQDLRLKRPLLCQTELHSQERKFTHSKTFLQANKAVLPVHKCKTI